MATEVTTGQLLTKDQTAISREQRQRIDNLYLP